MRYPNSTGRELEWLLLTLNTFQMQFLFQMNCFSYVWHHYNWHHVIGNRFLVNSLIILVNSFFHMSCYSQTSVNFLRTKNICWQKIIGVVIVNVAYYLKKEHHKYYLFSFGITTGWTLQLLNSTSELLDKIFIWWNSQRASY